MTWRLQQSHSQVESAVHSVRLTVVGVMRTPGPVRATVSEAAVTAAEAA